MNPEDHPALLDDATEALRQVIDPLESALDALDALVLDSTSVRGRDLEEALDDVDLQAVRAHLGTLVDRVDLAHRRLKDDLQELAEALIRTYPYDPEEPLTMIDLGDGPLGPLPAFTPRWGGSRTNWDHDRVRADLRAALQADVLGDPDSMTGDPADLVAGLLDRVEEVVSISGSSVKFGRKVKDPAKAKGGRRLGLDPEDYSEKTKAPPTVQVNRG